MLYGRSGKRSRLLVIYFNYNLKRMIKKILVLSVLLPLFITTTGLPLPIHFCNISTNADATDCKICDHNTFLIQMHTDCNCEDTHNYRLEFKNQDCCVLKIINVRIKDSFLSGTKIKNILKVVSHPLSISLQSIQTQKTFPNSNFNFTPLLLQSNNLYLINSIFLI